MGIILRESKQIKLGKTGIKENKNKEQQPQSDEENIFEKADEIENQKKKKVLTHYFQREAIAYPDSENFFGNGIVLHKLRTSTFGRYYNSITLLKMLCFEPMLVSLQMIPGLQIFILTSIQIAYVVWLAYCGFKEKIFSSKAIFLATLICDTSILVFLLLGLVFHVSGGVKSWPVSTSTPLQFAGVALLLLSCVFGLVDLVVSVWLVVKQTLAKRKVSSTWPTSRNAKSRKKTA